ncbi:hypothetical protein B0J18DRAFT_16690 [Chaetomium sp. MPI-SDFR-AT-0129]|nr:hypothetical protein B0J18DRAFT_16690 [Chaetomium sp. MPI-SDFR-AT-0129]
MGQGVKPRTGNGCGLPSSHVWPCVCNDWDLVVPALLHLEEAIELAPDNYDGVGRKQGCPLPPPQTHTFPSSSKFKARSVLGNSTTLLTLIVASSLASYERHVIELLCNGKDKRARKFSKRKVCLTPTDQSPLSLNRPENTKGTNCLTRVKPGGNLRQGQGKGRGAAALYRRISQGRSLNHSRRAPSVVTPPRVGGWGFRGYLGS